MNLLKTSLLWQKAYVLKGFLFPSYSFCSSMWLQVTAFTDEMVALRSSKTAAVSKNIPTDFSELHIRVLFGI